MSDPRQDITNRILVHLEAGTPPWRKAWTSQSTRPINALSHRPYSGINNLLLGMAMMERPEFGLDNRFLTMKQGGKLKTRVRKGEKAAAFVVKMVEVERRNAKSEGCGQVSGDAVVCGFPCIAVRSAIAADGATYPQGRIQRRC